METPLEWALRERRELLTWLRTTHGLESFPLRRSTVEERCALLHAFIVRERALRMLSGSVLLDVEGNFGSCHCCGKMVGRVHGMRLDHNPECFLVEALAVDPRLISDDRDLDPDVMDRRDRMNRSGIVCGNCGCDLHLDGTCPEGCVNDETTGESGPYSADDGEENVR